MELNEGAVVTGTEDGIAKPESRRRGRPLRIDRSRIVEVAKTFDPRTVTMQAVADELGVDPKALNYHVTNRDGLLRLVAADVFETHFSTVFRGTSDEAWVGTVADWRGALRLWAIAVRDSLVATGSATNYFRISGDSPAIFEPVEFVLQKMIAAGFDLPTASRGLILLTRVAMGVGRDMVLESLLGEHPQGPEVRQVLDDADAPGRFEALRWLVAADLNGPDDINSQFEFEVQLFIEGMEMRLPADPA